MSRFRSLVAITVLAGVGVVGFVAAPVHAAPVRPTAPTQPLVYVVVKGDSLTVIANKLRVTMADLLAYRLKPRPVRAL
ncbi:MAG: LysM domain-containing protein, partial [Actinomycetota bacterium]